MTKLDQFRYLSLSRELTKAQARGLSIEEHLFGKGSKKAIKRKHSDNGTCTVYFIQMGEDGPIKIGKTIFDIGTRLNSLQTGNPFKLKVLSYLGDVPEILEKQLHIYFSEHRMEGEWFKPFPEILEFAEHIKNGKLGEILNKFEERLAENKTEQHEY